MGRELQKDNGETMLRLQKPDSIDTHLAAVAHEIINVINVLSLQLELMELTENFSGKGKESMKICNAQVERIVRFIKNSNQHLHITTKLVTPQNLNAIIEEVLAFSDPRLKLENVTLELCLQDDLPVAPLDKFRIEQVALNLINNALDAMSEKKEKVLHIATKLEVLNGDKVVQAIFSDRRTGIKKEAMSKLFDPYFTTKEAGNGLGLGLFVCREIIRNHGGRIRAENNEWGGATFIFELPVNEKSASDIRPS